MREDWIFILAPAPRSGSTLIQRIVNASPEVFIWGEPRILRELVKVRETLIAKDREYGGKQRETFLSGKRNTRTEVMVPDPERIVPATRLLLSELLEVPGKRPGFKEILADAKSIALLDDCFPRSKFIFIVRRPKETYRSLKAQHWNQMTVEGLAREWRENSKAALDFVARVPERSLLLRYEDLNDEDCEHIFAFLKLPFTTEATTVFGTWLSKTDKKEPLSDEENGKIDEVCGETEKAVYGCPVGFRRRGTAEEGCTSEPC